MKTEDPARAAVEVDNPPERSLLASTPANTMVDYEVDVAVVRNPGRVDPREAVTGRLI